MKNTQAISVPTKKIMMKIIIIIIPEIHQDINFLVFLSNDTHACTPLHPGGSVPN